MAWQKAKKATMRQPALPWRLADAAIDAALLLLLLLLLQITGGNPMLLSGNVVLCSRADADSQRHFDGKLAYLGE